jgi:predicted GIY-YIG superfamily endonuclease
MKHFKRKLSQEPILGVYQIKNIINGKIYIGKSIDIEERWNNHKYGNDIVIHKSIRKYGLNNFEFTILETIESIEREIDEKKLCFLEQKWLDNKKPYLKENGYNINKTSKPNLTSNRNGDFSKKISKIKIEMNHCGKPIIQYSRNGDFISEWRSAADVERALKIKSENISRVCLKKQKTAGNFIWRFKDESITENEIKDINTLKRNRKKVDQLTKSGEYIRTFNSIKEAIVFINGSNTSRIVSVCKGNDNSYKGYKWRYTNERI